MDIKNSKSDELDEEKAATVLCARSELSAVVRNLDGKKPRWCAKRGANDE
jgi:hypothetical protein